MKKKRELVDNILDPNFIYDEFGKKKFHKELRKRVITLNCQRCDTEKFISKKYFKD